jgi:hypothetical protein
VRTLVQLRELPPGVNCSHVIALAPAGGAGATNGTAAAAATTVVRPLSPSAPLLAYVRQPSGSYTGAHTHTPAVVRGFLHTTTQTQVASRKARVRKNISHRRCFLRISHVASRRVPRVSVSGRLRRHPLALVWRSLHGRYALRIHELSRIMMRARARIPPK